MDFNRGQRGSGRDAGPYRVSLVHLARISIWTAKRLSLSYVQALATIPASCAIGMTCCVKSAVSRAQWWWIWPNQIRC